jgi:hypothetical protein
MQATFPRYIIALLQVFKTCISGCFQLMTMLNSNYFKCYLTFVISISQFDIVNTSILLYILLCYIIKTNYNHISRYHLVFNYITTGHHGLSWIYFKAFWFLLFLRKSFEV